MVTQVSIGRKQLGNGKPAWLAPAAADSLRRVDRALKRTLPVNWAGRTYAEQEKLWLKYGKNPAKAARPGTSLHEQGLSIDTDDRPVALLLEHGWKQTVKKEPWHFTYSASRDKHRNDPAPTNGGAKPAPVTPKESDTMQSIRVNGNIYGVDTEFIKHYGNMDQANITRRVTSATDELHELGNGNAGVKNLSDLLDGLGIPRSVLDAKGKVLNPQSGKFEANGTWSRRREILAAQARLEAKIDTITKLVAK